MGVEARTMVSFDESRSPVGSVGHPGKGGFRLTLAARRHDGHLIVRHA
jgi:hypothetical protein